MTMSGMPQSGTTMSATIAAPASATHAAAPGEARVDALTGVRALAAGWVVAYHLWLNAGRPPLAWHALGLDATPLAAMGWLGVDIFFVLSGFVLTWQVLHDPRGDAQFARATFWRDSGRFLRRRVLRVFPAYLATLTVLLPLGFIGLAPPAHGVRDVALHLVMLHNYVAAYVDSINGVYWSMPFEWQFYLLFPLLVLPVVARRSAWLLAGGLAVAVAMKLWSALAGPGDEIAQFPWRADQFVVGMAAAVFAVRRAPSSRMCGALAWLGVLALVAGAWLFGRYDAIWWEPGAMPFVRAAWIDLTVAMLLIGLFRPASAVARFFAWRPVVWLGLVSYSIYLWHLPTLQIVNLHVRQAFPALPGLPGLAVALAAILAVSALSFYLVEQPFHAPSRNAPSRWRDPSMRLRAVVAWAVALLLAAVFAIPAQAGIQS
jgi:peptidoglycan/LPS O-acetylase OafA/YrhL